MGQGGCWGQCWEARQRMQMRNSTVSFWVDATIGKPKVKVRRQRERTWKGWEDIVLLRRAKRAQRSGPSKTSVSLNWQKWQYGIVCSVGNGRVWKIDLVQRQGWKRENRLVSSSPPCSSVSLPNLDWRANPTRWPVGWVERAIWQVNKDHNSQVKEMTMFWKLRKALTRSEKGWDDWSERWGDIEKVDEQGKWWCDECLELGRWGSQEVEWKPSRASQRAQQRQGRKNGHWYRSGEMSWVGDARWQQCSNAWQSVTSMHQLTTLGHWALAH